MSHRERARMTSAFSHLYRLGQPGARSLRRRALLAAAPRLHSGRSASDQGRRHDRARFLCARQGSARLHRIHLFAFPHAGARGLQGLGAVLRQRFPLAARHRGSCEIRARIEGGALRAARLHAEGNDQDGRRGADRLSAQELVVADAVQLRASERHEKSHARNRQSRKRRLSASHAMGRRRGYRRACR